VFERFTDKARRVIVLAQEEARALDHNYIGTEHILLGLLGVDDGVGARALIDLGVDLVDARAVSLEMIGKGSAPPDGDHIPFTPRGKRVLELSLRESVQLANDFIGTEHILLGLLREEEGVAAKVLTERGVTHKGARAAIVAIRQARDVAAGAFEEVTVAMGVAGTAVAMKAPIEHGLVPMCPRCKGAIEEVGAYKTLDIPEDGGSGSIRVQFVFCEACGYAFASKILDA
jgi:ATP-dependent Clp protease ATP-binding subunit ClpA